METTGLSEVSTLLTKEKQEEVDKLFKNLVEVHIDIQKNLITLKSNYINGQNQSQLLYRELESYFVNFRASVFFQLCGQCSNRMFGLKKFPALIRYEPQYQKFVQEFKDIQDFTVKYMCFLSRSRNFGNESTPNNHLDIIKENFKSSIILGEMYEKLSRKYLNQMTDSEPITASSLASQLGILKKTNVFKRLFNVQVLLEMLVYFLADNVDVPATSTKSDATDESANVQVIKIMRDSLEELIDEMKTLRMHQKTYTEDVIAIKEISIHQKNYIEDIIAIKKMLENVNEAVNSFPI